jgi:serine/threonine-protein kinase RsbW
MSIEEGSVTVHLEMPSRLELLEKAREAVGQFAEVAGFDEDSLVDVQVAVHEALINAIVHGNQCDEARRVSLEMTFGCGCLDIRVGDEGRGFSPACIPDPLALENVFRSSGRGILLMKGLMDALAFHRPAKGGMEVSMKKRLARAPESVPPRSQVEALGA